MVRDAVREMEQTRRHKEESTVTVYRATPEQIEKMLGGKDMGRPAGSKNKSKIKVNTDREVEKREVKEVEVVKIEEPGEPGESEPQKIKKEEIDTHETIPEHMDEFRRVIQRRHLTGCKIELKFALEKELNEASSDTLRDVIYRIMGYCEETLKQIKKDI